MLRSEDSDTIREASSHNHQIDLVPGAYNNSYHAVKPQDMVQEPQRQATNFPHPIINLGDILDLCQFAEIDPDLLLSAYTKLRDTNDQMDSFSFIGDWINANEVKSNTFTKVVMKFGGAIKNNHEFCSGLKGHCENLEVMYFNSQESLQENRKTITALEEGIHRLQIQAGEMKEALGASNELAFECRASVQTILGELSQIWLVTKETRELTERNTKLILDECKREAVIDAEALKLQFAQRIEEIGKIVDASLIQHRGMVDEAIKMAEFKHAQEVEYRSQAEQARITEWNSKLTKIEHAQDSEIRDAIQKVTKELSEATSLSRKAMVKSEETHSEMRKALNEDARAASMRQESSASDVDKLRVKLERLESEISLRRSTLQPLDVEELLARKGLDKIREEFSGLLIKLDLFHSDFRGFKTETSRRMQDLSESQGAVRCEPEVTTQLTEFKSLIGSLESRLLALEQRAATQSALLSTQTQGHRNEAKGNVQEPGETEKEKETRQPRRKSKGRPPKADKSSAQRVKSRDGTETKSHQGGESKGTRDCSSNLDRWITNEKGVRKDNRSEQIGRAGKGKTKESSEAITKLENVGPDPHSSFDCIKHGCESCISLKQRVENLEAELLAVKHRHEDLKKMVPDKTKIIDELRSALKNPHPTQSVTIQAPSQPNNKTSEPGSSSQTVTIRGRSGPVADPKKDKPKLRTSSKEFDTSEYHKKSEMSNIAVRGIHRLKYSSTCYINAAIQTLFSIQEFSDFLKSNKFDRSHHPLLLQLQKLHQHCRSTLGQKSTSSYFSNKELIDYLNSKKVVINPEKQEDSTEFFERLVEEVTDEMRKNTEWRNIPNVKELLKANIICTIACKECGHGNIIDYTHTTVHLEHAQAGQADTTVSKKVRELLRQKEKKAMCTVCQRETRLEDTFNYQFSKYLSLKVARNTWNTKKNKMERTEHRINPEKSFDLKSEQQKGKARYNLIGGIIHKGGANSGHYLSVLLISQRWYQIDDANVSIIPEKLAIQQLESHGVLIMYQKDLELHSREGTLNNVVSNATRQGKSETKQEPIKGENQSKKRVDLKEDKKTIPPDRRHRRPRLPKRRKSFRPKRAQWKKIYIEKPNNSYYDPDKRCFYIPRT
jgi:ubiquitin C-terminal hydrolase